MAIAGVPHQRRPVSASYGKANDDPKTRPSECAHDGRDCSRSRHDTGGVLRIAL